MLRKSTTKLCAGAAVLSLLALTAGCSQKAAYKGGIKDQDLVPLRYPQSAMTVGALGWGQPNDALEAFRPGPENLNEELLAAIPTAQAAWFGKEKSSEMFLGVVAKPGPEVLSAIELANANAGAAVKREGMTFVDWGDLTERSLDMERLSKAIVRGWYNFPGEAIRFDALTSFRPDLMEYDNRPWIVQRSVTAEGLQYEVSRETGALLAASGSNPLYGTGAVTTGVEMTSATTLEVRNPMVIGITAAELRSIDPPLPAVAIDVNAGDVTSHTFRWKVRGMDKSKWEVTVSSDVLRAEARRAGIEYQVSEPVKQTADSIVTAAKTGEPVGMSLFAEARPRSGSSSWRRLGEGSSFDASELVRVHINLKEPAFVYILNKDSDGNAQVLYPTMSGMSRSVGDDVMLPAGDFLFPETVIGRDGMTFSAGRGTESFLVIASKTRIPGVMDTMKQFATALSAETAKGNSATRSGVFAFEGATRFVTGYADAAGTSTEAPPPPYYSGVEAATLMVLNLNKVPAP